jgi:hypothetical protein
VWCQKFDESEQLHVQSSESSIELPEHPNPRLSSPTSSLSPLPMDSRLIRRPVIDLLSGRSPCLLSLNTTTRRNESSFRRTKQRLNLKPDSSFILSRDSPRQDHIIFNPPSSAPSVYHTPVKFLPKEDKRKQILQATSSRLAELNPKLPPLLQKKVPNNHLTDKEIEEIQTLRKRQPEVWTNGKLARKFGCSNSFISICLSHSGLDNSEREAEMKAKLEAVKAKWGPRRRKAREEREKRLELAFRGE